MILADDVLLLLTDDASGRPVGEGDRLDLAVAGAVLLELLLHGRLRVAGPGESVRAGRVVVQSQEPVGDAVLDEALARAAGTTPKKPQSLLAHLRPGLVDAVRARLVERGLLADGGAASSVAPRDSWPAEDAAHDAELRARLREVLAEGREPDPREAGLVALLQSVHRVPEVLGDLGSPAAEARARAVAIAQHHVVADAVRRAISATTADRAAADGA